MSDDDATEASTAPAGSTEVAPTPTAPRKTKQWQKVTSVVLLVIGFILVPLSAVAIWSHNQLTNTDRYVETVSPLADNEDIQQAVAARVVNALFERGRPGPTHRERACPIGPRSSASPSPRR